MGKENFYFHRADIPEDFYAYETGKPIEHCISCDKNLLETDSDYIIEKAIKQYTESKVKDVIFEYAMCFDCIEKMKEKISEKSMNNIMKYMMNSSSFEQRQLQYLQNGNYNVHDWIGQCVVKGSTIENLPEYQIACQCKGNQMIFSHMPYMISYEATEELQEVLSAETKDELDRFYKDNFGVPPEFEEFFNRPKVFLV